MKFTWSLLFCCLLLASCDDDNTDSGTDFAPQLNTIGNTVIVPTYKALDDQTAALVSALTALESQQSNDNLLAAQQAWRNARLPWEQSEGFLFGPVDQQGIDPAMDSWPVNEIDLENVLNSGQALTKEYIDAQEGTVKGFHTIEYLIFGLDGNKAIGNFTQREFEYLRACAQSLKGETAKLYNAWDAAQGNFIRNLTAAGTSQSIYPSESAAIQEAVNGLITITDEVANGKINEPLSLQDVAYEESRFSANSKSDFADNMRSVRNIYLGSLDGSESPAGLHKIVAEGNASLDTRIKGEIAAAISKIEAIPGTFTSAVFNNKTEVIAAQEAIRTLQETLQSELIPYIQGLN